MGFGNRRPGDHSDLINKSGVAEVKVDASQIGGNRRAVPNECKTADIACFELTKITIQRGSRIDRARVADDCVRQVVFPAFEDDAQDIRTEGDVRYKIYTRGELRIRVKEIAVDGRACADKTRSDCTRTHE